MVLLFLIFGVTEASTSAGALSFPRKGDYRSAKQICEGTNTSIPSALSLQIYLPRMGWTFPDLPIWVSLTRTSYPHWRGLDGQHFTDMINLNRKEGEDCCLLNTKDERIGEIYCNEPIGGYTCYFKDDRPCPMDAVACYKSWAFFLLPNASWYDGYNHCSRKGGQLARIDREELPSISKILQGKGHFALGVVKSIFTQESHQGKEIPEYFNWEETYPSHIHNCSVLLGRKLRSVDCENDSYYFMCLNESDTTLFMTNSNRNSNATCDHNGSSEFTRGWHIFIIFLLGILILSNIIYWVNEIAHRRISHLVTKRKKEVDLPYFEKSETNDTLSKDLEKTAPNEQKTEDERSTEADEDIKKHEREEKLETA